ncbi:MAG: hypothetical protein IT525_02765 [Nitrosomonas sp.]|nr:hypothetical protein [Nitrosomonas sp.]
MGFVNERIEIEGKLPEFQTIDRERNIVLKKVGGGVPDTPLDFNLNINGEEINFSAFQKICQKMKEERKPEEKPYRIEWRVVEIYGPSHLKSDKSKLFPLIAEVLDAYGFASSRKNVESVTVTFAPNL